MVVAIVAALVTALVAAAIAFGIEAYAAMPDYAGVILVHTSRTYIPLRCYRGERVRV
jgi:hypothetical protein